MPDDDDKERGLEGFDTVPPPPGEDDAYSAQTCVRTLPAALAELMRDEEQAPRHVDADPKPATVEVSIPKAPPLPQLDRNPMLEPQGVNDEWAAMARAPVVRTPSVHPNVFQPEVVQPGAREQFTARPPQAGSVTARPAQAGSVTARPAQAARPAQGGSRRVFILIAVVLLGVVLFVAALYAALRWAPLASLRDRARSQLHVESSL